MNEFWQTTISTIMGTAAGFALAELAAYFKSKREHGGRVAGARLMIRLEIEQNLDVLREIEHKLELTSNQRDRRLAELAPATWSHQLWESQLPSVPDALSETEIRAVANFHEDLDSLSSMHGRIAMLWIEGTRAGEAARGQVGSWLVGSHYVADARNLAEEFLGVMERLLQRGNPLDAAPKPEPGTPEARNF